MCSSQAPSRVVMFFLRHAHQYFFWGDLENWFVSSRCAHNCLPEYTARSLLVQERCAASGRRRICIHTIRPDLAGSASFREGTRSRVYFLQGIWIRKICRSLHKILITTNSDQTDDLESIADDSSPGLGASNIKKLRNACLCLREGFGDPRQFYALRRHVFPEVSMLTTKG